MTREDWEVVYDPTRDWGQIRHKQGTEHNIQFQHGPIGDNGINGIQNEELIALLIMRLEQLDLRMPCDENKEALTGLNVALVALAGRTAKREAQGVEGTVRPHSSTEERL